MTNTSEAAALEVLDLGVVRADIFADVIAGLSKPQKELPSKYFYDRRGSKLFDRITELEEYYPTRTEVGILRTNIREIVDVVGSNVLLVEYGSGSSLKTRFLLDNLKDLCGYVPIDISRQHLIEAAEKIARDYPDIEVLPVVADYTADIELPEPTRPATKTTGFFPGSTIGNFDHPKAEEFLCNIARECGPGGGLLIGVDLKKDVEMLERAYDDEAGVTAAFNKNLLVRVNRELDVDFDPDQFEHEARWVEDPGRIEMHLRSLSDQMVHVGEHEFRFRKGETIHTENSHKFSIEQFAELARPWFEQTSVWTDKNELFSVQYLAVR